MKTEIYAAPAVKGLNIFLYTNHAHFVNLIEDNMTEWHPVIDRSRVEYLSRQYAITSHIIISTLLQISTQIVLK